MRNVAVGLALVVAMIGVAAALGRPDSPVADGLRVGVSANLRSLPPPTMARRAEQIRAVGLGWVREDVSWARVEAVRGRRDWSTIDAVFETTAARGLRVLPIVTYTPDWAGPRRLGPPDDPDAFAEFTAAVVARYGPGGTFWDARSRLDRSLAPHMFEIWNEPYIDLFWQPAPDPAEYARLFVAAARAGSRADARARFMLAGELEAGGRPFLEAVYDAAPELPSLTAAVSVHPYSDEGPRATGPPRTLPSRVQRVEAIHELMRRRGDGEDPIWITEIGWPTLPQRNGVSERKQAQFLAETLELARTEWSDYVEAVFWYKWEGRQEDPAVKEQFFGLRAADGREKPALQRLRRELR